MTLQNKNVLPSVEDLEIEYDNANDSFEYDDNSNIQVNFNIINNGRYKLLKDSFKDIYLFDKDIMIGCLNEPNRKQVIKILKYNKIKTEKTIRNNRPYEMYKTDVILEKLELGFCLYIIYNDKVITLIEQKYILKIEPNKQYPIDKLYLSKYPYFISGGNKYKISSKTKEVLRSFLNKYIYIKDYKFYCVYNNKKEEVKITLITYEEKETNINGNKVKIIPQNIKISINNLRHFIKVNGTDVINAETDSILFSFYKQNKNIYGIEQKVGKFYLLTMNVKDYIIENVYFINDNPVYLKNKEGKYKALVIKNNNVSIENANTINDVFINLELLEHIGQHYKYK